MGIFSFRNRAKDMLGAFLVVMANIAQIHREYTRLNLPVYPQMKDLYLYGGNKTRTININWLDLINKS